MEACGEKSQDLEPAIKASCIMEGKGGRKSYFSLKKKSHTKIDPFAKQFLSQEAPPPISLETEGEVLGWSQYSPYSR